MQNLFQPRKLFLILTFIFYGEIKISLTAHTVEHQSEWKIPSATSEPSSCTGSVEWSDSNCIIGPVSINKDIATNVFHQLCPQQSGKNEAPSSCDYYIVCSGDGSLTVNRCPVGNHFDPIKKECIDSHLFECSYPTLKDPKTILRGKNNEYKRQAISYPVQQQYAQIQSQDQHLLRFCKEEGIFPHPYSCEYFIQCGSGGTYSEQKCPHGTLFNPLISVCDWKRNTHCDASFRGKRFIEDDNENLNSKTVDVHIINKRNTCNDNFPTPHPHYCNKFQICSNGRIFTQECALGTLFDPLLRICANAKTVDCKARLRDFDTYDCGKGHQYTTTHPDDCHKFIQCEDERIHIKTCPVNTVFNPVKGSCDFEYKGSCKAIISLEHDIDINYLQSTKDRIGRDLSNYVCEFNYIAPLDGTCNQFIECEDKRLFKKSCGPGTAYNRLIGQCDWPYNVRVQDPEYCSKYLQCDGRKFVPRECPINYKYDPLTGKCEPGNRVNCNGRRDSTGGFLQSK